MDPRRFPGGQMFGDDSQASCSGSVAGSSDGFRQLPFASFDPRIPLYNLSILRQKMASVRQFISQSLDQNVVMGKDQMNLVSTEIFSAIHQIIVNGAALLACSSQNNLGSQFAAGSVPVAGKVPDHGDLKAQTSSQLTGRVPAPSEMIAGKTPTSSLPVDLTTQTSNSIFQSSMESSDLHGFESNSIYGRTPNNSDLESLLTSLDSNKQEIGVPKIGVTVEQKIKDEIFDADCEIVELDAVELLAEHIHYCEICGKGFKRDANLRMHMRAHGNQFKTPEALAKPERFAELAHKIRFSCPFVGCNRNKSHKKFRSLKSAICVKNHFKRSHCPKMFSCNRCNKKSFSVLADLRSHLKHCGETKWRCSCGTTFSRKDKLFGHMALFEGHMPDVAERDEKSKGAIIMEEDEVEVEDEEEETQLEEGISGLNGSDNEFFDGLLEGFGSIDADYWKDVL